MDDNLTLSETSVADLLKKYPQTAKLFINRKTACVGCYMASFCTLEYVISTYEIDKDVFFDELNKVIKNPIQG